MSAACLLLAAALCCAPPASSRGRLATIASGGGPPGPARRWRPSAAVPVVGSAALALLLAGPGAALAAALAVVAVRRRRARARAEALATDAAGQVAAAVARIADELRAGSHPGAALAGTDADGPLARAVLAPAASAARLGEGVPGALRRAAGAHPEVARDVARVAAAWALAERSGVPLADVLGQAAEDVRWRLRFGAAVRAQLAGPRATAAVLTALPLLGVGLGQLVGADPVGVLREGLLGQVLLVIGVGLVAAGAAWSERILRRAVPR